MSDFMPYSVARRTTAQARMRVYQKFKGVDFSSDEAQVALQRSPNSLNMYKNYSVELGQCVETRPGFRKTVRFPKQTDNAVYGQIFFENRSKTVTKIQPLIHVGTKLYLWENYPQKADMLNEIGQNEDLTELYAQMNCADSAMTVFDGRVYIADGKQMLVFDSQTVQPVSASALVPTTYIGRAPLGGGTQYQQLNLLQDQFTNTFLSDGKSKDYYLSMTEIDAVTKVIVDGQTLTADQYTVDKTNGIVKFNTVPPARRFQPPFDCLMIRLHYASSTLTGS